MTLLSCALMPEHHDCHVVLFRHEDARARLSLWLFAAVFQTGGKRRGSAIFQDRAQIARMLCQQCAALFRRKAKTHQNGQLDAAFGFFQRLSGLGFCAVR